MKLPGLDTRNSLAPALQELLAQREEMRAEPLARRERISESIVALALLLACVGLAQIQTTGDFNLGHAIVLGAAYAIATNVQFRVGAGFTVPTQVVLVP